MKILIDLSYIQMDRLFKSLSIYIFRFLDTIEERGQFKLLVLKECEEYIKKRYPGFECVSYEPYSNNCRYSRLIKFIQRCWRYKFVVENSGCDCLFVPNDLVMFSLVKTRMRKVVVVHDLKTLKEKPGFKGRLSYIMFKFYYWVLMHYSDSVVAISRYTKEDIHAFFRSIPADKVKVVYNSVVLSRTRKEPINVDLPERYILYVNTLHPYKNIMTLVRAFDELRLKIDHKLVIVGNETDYWRNFVSAYITHHGLSSRVIRLSNISNEELRYLYEHASLFVSTSMREGFGYTPIEAAMCACPVVCSMCEALPDTTRGLLNYYTSAKDEHELANKICQVLNTPPSTEELEYIASTFADLYSPQKQSIALLEILRT